MDEATVNEEKVKAACEAENREGEEETCVGKTLGRGEKRRELQSSKNLASLGGWLALAICKPGIECIRKYTVLVVYFKI